MSMDIQLPLSGRTPDEQKIHDALLTLVELADYGEGDVSKEQLAELIAMVTPTEHYQTSVPRLSPS